MQKFDTNTLESQYIQSLLFDTWVPTVPVFSHIPEVSEVQEGQTIVTPNNIYVRKGNELQYVSPYVKGQFYPNITANYISKENYYSTSTHEALGRYLRFIRDLTDIDIMPLYNCFSNRYIHNMCLYSTVIESSTITGIQKSDTRDIVLVPVCNKHSYQIAIETSGQIIRCSLMLYDGQAFLADSYNQPITRLLPSFYTPQTVEVDIANFDIKDSKYLYLVLDIPSNLNSSIVVLERFGPHDYCQHPQLLAKNRYYQFAYSDKLFSYLLGNVITPGYEFQTSIEQLQELLTSSSFVAKYSKELGKLETYKLRTGTFDVGYGSMHNYIYNALCNEKILYNDTHDKEFIRDFTGYIDADVEYLINSYGTKAHKIETSTVGY